jgi:uncharacterized caspase-like protein
MRMWRLQALSRRWAQWRILSRASTVPCIALEAALLCGVAAFPARSQDGGPNEEGSGQTRTVVERAALVVGNANYRVLGALQNPRNDAEDVCAALTKLGYDTQCAYDVKTRREYRDLVRDFASKLGPKSVALFYYAGHGVQLNGENYLLGTELDVRIAADIEDEGLSLSYVFRSLEEARSAPNIVVLDACRDNPFPRKASFVLSKGLARVDPPIGTVLVYATAPNMVALDGRGRNGLFTKHLLAKMSQAGMKIDELLQIVSQAVQDDARKTYQRDQIPYRTSSYSGVFCLGGCDSPDLAKKLSEINRQSEDAARRIKELMDENRRLQREASERESAMTSLEAKISKLSRVEMTPEGSSSAAELKQLRESLNELRVRQAEAEYQATNNAAREKEIFALKTRITELQSQAKEVEDLRGQVAALRNQNKAQEKIIDEKKARSIAVPLPEQRKKRVVVPNF